MKNYFCYIFLLFSLPVYAQDSSNKIIAKINSLINDNRIGTSQERIKGTKLYLNKSTKSIDFDGKEINLKHCTFAYSDYFDKETQKTSSLVSFNCDENFDCILNSTSYNNGVRERVLSTGFLVKSKEIGYEIINLLSDLKISLNL